MKEVERRKKKAELTFQVYRFKAVFLEHCAILIYNLFLFSLFMTLERFALSALRVVSYREKKAR